MLDKKWGKQYFINKQISLSSPFLLEEDNIEIPVEESVKKVLLSKDHYIYKTNSNFSVLLSRVTYNPSIVKVNLKGASDGTAHGAVAELKGTDLFYNDESIFVNQHPAILKKGNFHANDQEYHFKIITCIQNDLTLINLVTVWVGKNEDYELLTDRIVNSLQIR